MCRESVDIPVKGAYTANIKASRVLSKSGGKGYTTMSRSNTMMMCMCMMRKRPVPAFLRANFAA